MHPLAFDRFAYVNNNPLKFTDPTGHGAYCGDDYDLGCLSPQERGAYYQMSGEWETLPPYRSTPKPTPTPPPTPTPVLACTPTPTETPPPSLDINIYVDWNNVDLIDAGIDVFGLVANGVALISIPLGAEPVALVAETAGGIVEFGGFLKSGVELIQGDPSSMLLDQTTSQTERVAVMIFRGERVIPGVGFVGNIVSLAINLKPRITIQWVTP